MKLLLIALLLSTICTTVRADSSSGFATVEISVYQSTEEDIGKSADAKRWMQQKLVVSHTIETLVPNSVRVESTIDGILYDFRFYIGDSYVVRSLGGSGFSIQGIAPIAFNRVEPSHVDEWFGCAARCTKTGNHTSLSTLVVVRYSKTKKLSE